MNLQSNYPKGIHPGLILDMELKERHFAKGKFALSLQEYPQTIVSITKGKRRMNTGLALKIEKALDLEEGYLMIMQVYYDIEQLRSKQNIDKPNLSKLRSVLFWDTSIEKIDWQKQKKAVIKRVFERGNDIEKNEITLFYGEQIIQEILNEK
jgi:antitoxin HigA-1